MPFPETLPKPSYTSPLEIKLRQLMKRDFMQALSQQPNPFEGKLTGCAFWVFGSSIMNVAWHTGTRFPLKAKKALDLDIGISFPSSVDPDRSQKSIVAAVEDTIASAIQSLDANVYEKTAIEYTEPLLDTAWRSKLSGGKPVLVENFQLKKSSSPRFTGTLFLAKHYTKEEIETALADDPEMKDIHISEKGQTVVMDTEIFTSKMPMLLDPIKHEFFKDASTPVLVDDCRNMLAKKLARAIYPHRCDYSSDPTGFKPRDLVDIYNIIHANPPLMDIDPKSPTSDIPLLRMLVVTNMYSLNKPIERINLSNFNPNDMDRIDTWRKEMQHIFISTYPLSDEMCQNIFGDVQKLYRAIFPEREMAQTIEGDVEKVVLYPEEMAFFDRIRGIERLPTGGGRAVRQITPDILPELITTRHADYFSVCGKLNLKVMLERNIKGMPGLNDLVGNLRERRESAIGGE